MTRQPNLRGLELAVTVFGDGPTANATSISLSSRPSKSTVPLIFTSDLLVRMEAGSIAELYRMPNKRFRAPRTWLLRTFFAPAQVTSPGAEARKLMAKELASDPNLGVLNVETAVFVAAAISGEAERIRDAIRTLEQKANTTAGFAAGLIAIIADNNRLMNAPKAALVAAVVVLFVAVVSALLVGMTSTVGIPGSALYNWPSSLLAAQRALIAHKNAEAWNDYLVLQSRALSRKAIFLHWEIMFFLTGVALVSFSAVRVLLR